MPHPSLPSSDAFSRSFHMLLTPTLTQGNHKCCYLEDPDFLYNIGFISAILSEVSQRKTNMVYQCMYNAYIWNLERWY